MPLKVYDQDRVSISICGLPIDTGSGGPGGYASGDFLTVKKNEKNFNTAVGTDGEVTRSKNANRSATVTLRLMQSSSANLILSGLAQLDMNAPNGAGVGAFQVKDLSGTTLLLASECWIEEVPEEKFGNSAQERVWVFGIASLIDIHGGN